MNKQLRVLICTVVHNPTDARIFRREIGAILAAGHLVTAIAPWKSDTPGDERVRRVAVPRAVGRNRWQALIAARSRMRELVYKHDLLIVHDPELLVAIPWRDARSAKCKVVWDVHEDLAASVLTKSYIPVLLRKPIALAVRQLENWAENRATLLLAESAYQNRFHRTHTQVLNLPLVPAELPALKRKRQAIYVGSITRARGLTEMLQLARLLEPHGIKVTLIGETHNDKDAQAIQNASNVQWVGPLPNAEALQEVEQSLFGLSLLANLPNYEHSMPTKVLEYMASGAIVVTTPLPLAIQALDDFGIVAQDFTAASLPTLAAQIAELANDDAKRVELAAKAFARVQQRYDWNKAGHEFVQKLESIVSTPA